MKQHDLESAVARRTGESLACVRRLGFSLVPVVKPRMHRKGARHLRTRSVSERDTNIQTKVACPPA